MSQITFAPVLFALMAASRPTLFTKWTASQSSIIHAALRENNSLHAQFARSPVPPNFVMLFWMISGIHVRFTIFGGIPLRSLSSHNLLNGLPNRLIHSSESRAHG